MPNANKAEERKADSYITSGDSSNSSMFSPFSDTWTTSVSKNGPPPAPKGYGDNSLIPSDLLDNYYAYKNVPDSGKGMYEPAISGKPHIFIVKPAILPGLEKNNNNTFKYLNNINGLASKLYHNSPTTYANTICIPISNLALAMSTEDVTMSTINNAETQRGYVQKIPSETSESKGGGDIEITYRELQYPLVTLFHKIWFDYTYNVRFGFYQRPKNDDWLGIIDYATAIYYFLVGPDGKTITYWCRFIGVLPTSIPYSSFNGELGSSNIIEVRCAYAYSVKQNMDYDIIEDFNKIAGGGSGANEDNSETLPIGGSSLSIKVGNNGVPEFDFSPSIY